MSFRITTLSLLVALTGCATNSSPLDSVEIKPKSSKDYYLDQRASSYEQKNKNLSSEEARAKAQADYNLFSDPVTGEIR